MLLWWVLARPHHEPVLRHGSWRAGPWITDVWQTSGTAEQCVQSCARCRFLAATGLMSSGSSNSSQRFFFGIKAGTPKKRFKGFQRNHVVILLGLYWDSGMIIMGLQWHGITLGDYNGIMMGWKYYANMAWRYSASRTTLGSFFPDPPRTFHWIKWRLVGHCVVPFWAISVYLGIDPGCLEHQEWMCRAFCSFQDGAHVFVAAFFPVRWPCVWPHSSTSGFPWQLDARLRSVAILRLISSSSRRTRNVSNFMHRQVPHIWPLRRSTTFRELHWWLRSSAAPRRPLGHLGRMGKAVWANWAWRNGFRTCESRVPTHN